MEPPASDHEQEKIERLRRAMYSRQLSEKLKERPRRAMDEIRPIVGEDWREEERGVDQTTVAPRTINLARRALWWVLGGAIVFFLAAAGFFGYYFLVGGGSLPAAPGNIDIIVSGPPQIAGGEPTQLQITVTNRNNTALQLADLVITYPEGTRSVGSGNFTQFNCSRPEGTKDPTYDFPQQRICLGSIEPGGSRQGTVSAVFSGESGKEVEIKADLEYRIGGSSAIFVSSSQYHTSLSSSPILLTVEGNTETVSGQPVELRITAASNANTIIKDALVSISYPFGFTFTSANPSPKKPGFWELGDFAPGQKKEIVLRGTLTGESGDERVFRVTLGTRKSPSEGEIATALSENAFKLRVSDAFLGLGVAVNKVSGTGAVVAPKENVNVVVSWQNNLGVAVTDAVIVARLTGLTIDGTSVHSIDGFFRSSDNSVIWDKSTTGGVLSSIPAGAKGTVSFTFQMPASEALAEVRNPSLTITVNAAGKRLSESGVPQNLQSTASQRVAVASDLTVSAQGLYYANPFGSSGPMPPKAGSETTYAIVFTLTNTTNKVTGGKLRASLPPYVRWVGIYSPSSENLSFNQTDSTVTWDVGALEPGVGLGGTQPRQAAIAIGFTPSTSQIGQEPILLQDITFTGIDDATKKAVSKDVRDVTTNIVGDPGFSASSATVVR
ncbi:MAG: hypothetical protein HYS26_00165 [Candidatus Kaiserbacteria bacterium]|nr:MAG: hypothetical protein HYS26_00165 [Candidatus Kaiserbacteria bacterium]